MTRFLCVALLATIVSQLAAQERLLITNQSNNSAELIDLSTLASLAVTPVGQQPGSAAVTPDRRYGLVASVGRFAPAQANGDLVVLDITNPAMPVVATLSPATRVFNVEASPDNRFALLVRTNRQSAHELLQVDLTATPPTLVGNPIPIAGAQSLYDVEITPDAKTAYLLDFQGSTLTQVDLTQSPPAIVGGQATNRSAIYMDLSNDGLRLLTASISLNAAGIWDTSGATPTKVGNVSVGQNPGADPCFERGSSFCLVASATGQTVDVIDAHATTPVTIGTLSNVAPDLRGIAATTDGLRGWVAARNSSKMLEIDLTNRAAPMLTNRSIAPASGPNSIVAFGPVHALGAAVIGSSVPVFFASPNDAGRSYVLGASFNSRPGTPIGARNLPLALDDLLLLSQTQPSIFQGFAGTLSATGQATATINIPSIPGLSGFGFYVAGIVLDPAAPNGIRTISNAEHIVVR